MPVYSNILISSPDLHIELWIWVSASYWTFHWESEKLKLSIAREELLILPPPLLPACPHLHRSHLSNESYPHSVAQDRNLIIF